ncbi:hypothetical protein IJU97_01115 [bacterium]|nr:hypothetical protein [bacterium]
MYHRYTNFFVDLLQTDQQDSNLELIGDLAEGFKKYNIENADISAAQELLSNNT